MMVKAKQKTRLVRMNTGVYDAEYGLFDPDRVYELPEAMAVTLVNDRAADWADERLVPENAAAIAAPINDTETKELSA